MNSIENVEAAQAAVRPPDRNEKYLILAYQIGGARYSVYLLNPGDMFQGFGGSRHPLMVKKTASLVIRRLQHELSDREYNINDTGAWEAIRYGFLLAHGVRTEEPT